MEIFEKADKNSRKVEVEKKLKKLRVVKAAELDRVATE